MPLSRWSKVLYASSAASPPSKEGTPVEPDVDQSARYQARSAITCLAPNPRQGVVALVGRDGIEICRPGDAHFLRSNHPKHPPSQFLKTNARLIPTSAVWQGQAHEFWDAESARRSGLGAAPVRANDGNGFVGSTSSGNANEVVAPPGDSLSGPHSGVPAPPHPERLIVSDSNGSFRLYELTNTGLQATATSGTVGRAIRSLSTTIHQPAYLLTGISDGSVKLWDLRQKLVRPQLAFNRPGDVTREVQFQPSHEWKFASIYDSGIVQRWDLRNRQIADCRISAHQQGLSLDWHPRLNYLATGGQDHLVQIWNMHTEGAAPADLLGGAPAPDLVVQTPSAVRQVKWIDAPHATDILPCGVVTTTRRLEGNSQRDVYKCWSLKQPFLPVHTVEAHSGSVSGVYVAHPQQIWSAGSDGVFAQTDLRFEPTVRSNLPPALAVFPPWDSALVTFPCTQEPTEPTPLSSHSTLTAFHRRSSQIATNAVGEAVQRLPLPRANSHFGLGSPELYLPSSGNTSRETALGLHSVSSLSIANMGGNHGSHLGGGNSTVGSVPGNGSVVGSIPGSVAGSVPSSLPGSIPNSVPGSTPGSLPGSLPGSMTVPSPLSIPRSFSVTQISHSPLAPPTLATPRAPPTAVSPRAPRPLPNSSSTTPSTPSAQPWANQLNYFGDPASNLGEPKFLVEIGLPYDDGSTLRAAVANLAFLRLPNQTYADVCRHNARVLHSVQRYRYAELWDMLAIAAEELEADFLRSLNSANLPMLGVGFTPLTAEDWRGLAERWFAGSISDNFEVRDEAVEIMPVPSFGSQDAPLFEDDGTDDMDATSQAGSEWLASEDAGSVPKLTPPVSRLENLGVGNVLTGSLDGENKARRRHFAVENMAPKSPQSKLTASIRPKVSGQRSASTSSKLATEAVEPLPLTAGRPHHNTTKDPFQVLRAHFWEFAESRQQPWHFLPVLHEYADKLVCNGFYTSASALLLIFRSVPSVSQKFDVNGIVRGGLLILEQYKCFVAAAEIRKALRVAADNDELQKDDYDAIVTVKPDKEILETVCHRCSRPLSDNAAFYARNDQAAGYYYCSRCRLLLDGCAFCDVPIRGLAKLITSCGHRLHIECWTTWHQSGFHECPSGCGQEID